VTVEQGIEIRPSLKEGGRSSYRAEVYDPRQKKKIRRTFSDLTAARKWRKDMSARLRVAPQEVPLSDPRTLDGAFASWLEDCRSGAIKSKRRLDYGRATLAGYESIYRTHIGPRLGHRKFTAITDLEIETLVRELQEARLHGRTIRNVITALQAFYYAHRKIVRQSPCRDIDLPDATSRQRRAISPDEAFALLDAISDEETCTVYALAFFAGLRRAEIRAFDESCLLPDRVVVSWGYDERSRERIPLKWRRPGDERTIPRTKALDRYIGRLPELATANSTITRRAASAWKAHYACGCIIPADGPEQCVEHHQPRMQGIELHECRHSYAVWLDAAGISNSRADRYTGHSNSTMGEHYRNHPLTSAQLVADAEALDAYLEPSAKAEVVTLRKAK
jgi:hypothetical protein